MNQEKISNMKKIKRYKDFNKKRKRTIIKKVSDGPYGWIPNFDRNSPAPESKYAVNIVPVKI